MSLEHSTFQILIVSLAPETTNFPSGENAMELTDLVWPSRGPEAISPVRASQIRTVLSADPDATYLPWGENTTVLILSEWPLKGPDAICPVLASQMRTVQSS